MGKSPADRPASRPEINDLRAFLAILWLACHIRACTASGKGVDAGPPDRRRGRDLWGSLWGNLRLLGSRSTRNQRSQHIFCLTMVPVKGQHDCCGRLRHATKRDLRPPARTHQAGRQRHTRTRGARYAGSCARDLLHQALGHCPPEAGAEGEWARKNGTMRGWAARRMRRRSARVDGSGTGPMARCACLRASSSGKGWLGK